MTKKTPIQLRFDPSRPEGKLKSLGGGKADEWNNRLSNLTINALPIAYSENKDAIVIDLAPADPLEGILIAQLMAASEASLAMYQKAWGQKPEFSMRSA